jgi:hypothetical protein
LSQFFALSAAAPADRPSPPSEVLTGRPEPQRRYARDLAELLILDDDAAILTSDLERFCGIGWPLLRRCSNVP